MDTTTGDPATMRYVAAQIRQNADRICELASQVVVSTRSFNYEGPAATTFFDVVARSNAAVCAEAENLYSLSTRLEAAAVTAESTATGSLT
jgi:uncharacterized protein YukE